MIHLMARLLFSHHEKHHVLRTHTNRISGSKNTTVTTRDNGDYLYSRASIGKYSRHTMVSITIPPFITPRVK